MTLSRLAIALCLVGSAASAAPTIIEFRAPVRGRDTDTLPQAINSQGDITGYYTAHNNFYGFLRPADGSFAIFSVSKETLAFDINDSGTIVGVYADVVGGDQHGFVRDTSGEVIKFDVPGASNTIPQAIGAKGSVVGWFLSGSVYRGFFRSPKGHLDAFDAPGAGTSAQQGTFAVAVNAHNVTAGYTKDDGNLFHGFVRAADGSFTTFDVCGSARPYTGTVVAAINANGSVVGRCDGGDLVTHGFVRAADGGISMIDIDCVEATADAINARGVVTGHCYGADKVYRAYQRNTRGEITMFSAPDAGSGDHEGTLSKAVDDRGDIVGYYWDQADIARGFVRTP